MPINKAKTEQALHGITVQNLSKSYGTAPALHGISFAIKPGEIVGFLGPNGAGKTTTMKILTCLLDASDGQAAVAGFDVRTHPAEVRKRIGYLPENIPLYDEMILYDYLHFIAEIRGVPRSKRKERITSVALQTGLDQVLARVIGELSKGYRQRIGLAQAIIHAPDVLILDEPTTGLDPNQLREIRDVIKEIGREKTVIFSTHILQEVTAVCDRIVIIAQGRLVADGTLDELSAQVPRQPDEQQSDEQTVGLEEVFRYFTTLFSEPTQENSNPEDPDQEDLDQEEPDQRKPDEIIKNNEVSHA